MHVSNCLPGKSGNEMHAILWALVIKHGTRYSDQPLGLDNQAVVLRSSTGTRTHLLFDEYQGLFPWGGGGIKWLGHEKK
jgi:hypothetical protein